MTQKIADDVAAIARRMAEIEQERQQWKDEQPISLEQWVPVAEMPQIEQEREKQRVNDGFAEMNQRYIEEIGRVVADAAQGVNVSHETNG